MLISLSFFYSLAIILGLSYASLIYHFRYHWRKQPFWIPPGEIRPKTRISVLIPARNEADNIEDCLHSIFDQSFPLHSYEVIVIDDHSTDGTAEIVENLGYPSLKVLRLADDQEPGATTVRSYKKKALETGIEEARGELIVCTDADCIAPRHWLSSIAGYYQEYQPAFISAPVAIHQERNTFERFQSLDLLGTMIITGAGIGSGEVHLANGANLAYPKSVFMAVGGFEGTDHLASGDDMLLLHKIAARFPGRIGFLKTAAATVCTTAQPDWTSFINQRLRWATKSSFYQENASTLIWTFVFMVCLAILTSPLLYLWYGPAGFGAFFILFSSKALADFILLRTATHFFDRRDLMWSFPLSQFLHIAYVVVIGFLVNFVKSFEWKGRRVR